MTDLFEVPPSVLVGSSRSRTYCGCPVCGIEVTRARYHKHVESELARLREGKFPVRGKLTDEYWQAFLAHHRGDTT